jgi:hypothetical protein
VRSRTVSARYGSFALGKGRIDPRQTMIPPGRQQNRRVDLMVRQGIEMGQTDTPRIRKRLMSDHVSMPAESAGEIDIASHASLAYWSEDPSHHPLGRAAHTTQGCARSPAQGSRNAGHLIPRAASLPLLC